MQFLIVKNRFSEKKELYVPFVLAMLNKARLVWHGGLLPFITQLKHARHPSLNIGKPEN